RHRAEIPAASDADLLPDLFIPFDIDDHVVIAVREIPGFIISIGVGEDARDDGTVRFLNDDQNPLGRSRRRNQNLSSDRTRLIRLTLDKDESEQDCSKHLVVNGSEKRQQKAQKKASWS